MPSTARNYQITSSICYHVFNRGNAKGVIYHNEQDYQRFIQIMRRYSQRRKMKIFHWVLMPNHFHILLEIEKPKELSGVMAGISRAYVHFHHKKYDSAGHLFQGRFKSQAIEKERYLLACGRYIERNPVISGFVSSAEEYPFSSAGYYVYRKTDTLTDKDPYFNTFGDTDNFKKEKYRLFLKDFNVGEEELFSNLESPCGSKEFLRRLVKERGLFVPRNGRPNK